MILYFKETGLPYCLVREEVHISDLLVHKTNEFIDSIYIYKGNVEDMWWKYSYYNGIPRKLTELELDEIMMFGAVLTDDERIIKKLKPSNAEVDKARRTLEYLDLMQEVGI